jgi:predicted RNA-binding protein with PUA domain
MAAVTLPIVTTYNNAGVKGAQGSLKSLVGSYATIGIATGAVSKLIQTAVTDASDLQETISKNKVIFGNSATDIEAWADGAAKNLGHSKKQAIDAADSFALFGKTAGLSGKPLLDFSKDFTGLATDMASFFNTKPEDAVAAIGSAFRGETEPIRKYGVMIDDASIKAQLLKDGLYDGSGALTAQQKILGVQKIIWEKTNIAQGDFLETSDGLANKSRILSAELDDLSAMAGSKLLPVVTDLTTIMNKGLTLATEKSTGETNKLVSAFGFLFKHLSPAGQLIKGMEQAASLLHLIAGESDSTAVVVTNTAAQFRDMDKLLSERYADSLKLTTTQTAALKKKTDELAASKKKAKEKAKDYADTLRERVVTAVDTVASSLQDAKDQLQSFADTTAESITGAVSLAEAFKTQTEAEENVADALKDRKDAYADAAKATKNVDDAMKKLIKTQKGDDADAILEATNDLTDAKLKLKEANDAVASSETAVTTAQNTAKNTSYSQVFSNQIEKAKHFAQNLTALVGQGLGKAGLAQLMNLGPVVGAQVTQEMLTGISGLTIESLNTSLGGLSTSAANLGLAAGNAFFGGNVAAGQAALSTVNNLQISVNAGLVSNPATVGRDIIEAILAAERLSGQVFVSA